MNISGRPTHKSPFPFWFFVTSLVALGVWSMITLRHTENIYNEVLAMQASEHAGSVVKASFNNSGSTAGSSTVSVPDWHLLQPGQILSLTSRDRPLPDGFTAPDLVETQVSHGDSTKSMKVQRIIETPLQRLYAAAEDDGIELMLSSAYRSIDDQRALYKSFVAKQGQAMADIYVAKPGTSEHHTGLAVDFASASTACEIDSDSCSLSQVAAGWLDEHGPAYGFIQRYPEGKQPLTGVAFEPWHYRYVGVPMAKAVASSGLTYDEAVRQFAPGYAK